MARTYAEIKADSKVIHDSHGWNAQSAAMRELLGLSRTAKLPAEGMPIRTIQGVKVWVEPLDTSVPHTWRNKRSTHRVKCQCPNPDCGKIMSAGRLFQHVCKTK